MTNDEISPLRALASCANGTCPTVYATARGTIVVQGYVVTPGSAGIEVPDGEQLVEIPRDLLDRALRDAETA